MIDRCTYVFLQKKTCMKFFIDTANLAEIKEANDLGILDGVTTNPSLMAKEGITGAQNILDHYVTICNIVDGPVSAEVNATDASAPDKVVHPFPERLAASKSSEKSIVLQTG